ncbi:MAG: esterase/lipase family protein [Bacillota bacterium]
MWFNIKVILIHGYNKNKNDMVVLKNNLEELNYQVYLVDLPLTFKPLEESVEILKQQIDDLLSDVNNEEEINFAAHSTGGLVVRRLIADGELNHRINRCVLIASPNKGSRLSQMSAKLPFFNKIFKTADSIKPKNVKKMDLKSSKEIEIGAAAGVRSNLLLGKFLNSKNDGRIRVDSVKYEGLKDFIELPYGHKEIHYRKETAELIDNFLRTGKFRG